MKFETIKTFILTFLIGLSAILTWNIWTFQPNYELIGNEDTVNEVALGSKMEIKNVVKPQQVVFHVAGEKYGTQDSQEIDELIIMLGKWKFYDIRRYADHSSELMDQLAKGKYTEFIFPDEIPIEIYRKVLNFEDPDMPKFDFDRMIIDVVAGEGSEGKVYFYSSTSQQSYIGNVNLAAINELFRNYFQKATSYDSYITFEGKDNKQIYLPKYATEMKKYTYLRNPIETELLRDAIFTDPRFVQRNFVSDGEEYIAEASKLTVNNKTNIITYVKPFRENESVIGTSNLIQRSIDFVNGHSGWTDPFRFVHKDDFNQQVVFRMYSDEGYPIFNQVGLSEIVQEWGQSEVKLYERPGFQLEMLLNRDVQKISLSTGSEVISTILQKTGLDAEVIEDITPGYYMLKNAQDVSVVTLEPGWFYLYNGEWYELTADEGSGV
ncbi:two-component system activity regulator YycH [Mesobacillus maritimus]|uniref:YycH family regulatory protein n=1 Tax=Mesobacillus maritimus TaxID=1643336 RepID=UPI00203D26A9|nr:two-component system activity regulator YycH [Mesobacillus maritimus]MCM3588158.1 two-component system activity regulator YycH [Mesobacillus maritimus]